MRNRVEDKFEAKVNETIAAWKAERELGATPLDIPRGAHSNGVTLIHKGVTKSILKKIEEQKNTKKSQGNSEISI